MRPQFGGAALPLDDPRVVRAFAASRQALEAAAKAWSQTDDAEEAIDLGRMSIEHLEAGRGDEAVATATAALELDEEHHDGGTWRDFAILVEEAAALIEV